MVPISIAINVATLFAIYFLQVMNLLQVTVLAGSPGGFLPNMYPGMVAATLARVIRTSAGGSWVGIEVRITEFSRRSYGSTVLGSRKMLRLSTSGVPAAVPT